MLILQRRAWFFLVGSPKALTSTPETFPMSFIKLYGRVLRLLGPEKWLALALVIANVDLAVSQVAEPLLFGRVIDQLSHAQGAGASLRWAAIGPWLGAWAGFGIFSIVAGGTLGLHAGRPPAPR